MLTPTSNSTKASYQLSVAGSQFVPAADTFFVLAIFRGEAALWKSFEAGTWVKESGKSVGILV